MKFNQRLIHYNKSKCLKVKITSYNYFHMNTNMKFNNICRCIRNMNMNKDLFNNKINTEYRSIIKNIDYNKRM